VQTALDFLAKNVFDLYVQLSYGVVKVRVLLQHLKGIRLDLDILGLDDERGATLMERAISLADSWFERSDGEERVAERAIDAFPVLRDALVGAMKRRVLYAPTEGPMLFAPNMTLEAGCALALARRGVSLPRVPGLRERRYFNAHHRLNKFRFTLPMTPAADGSYHAERFAFLRRAKSFAVKRFPAYSAPIPPLFYRAL
jgi:hypothetical protein